LLNDAIPALSVENLSYAFGARQVLHNVDLVVQPGDFSVLLGLNGAGKTTLFALITRLYSARSGKIAVFGNNIENNPLADLDLTVEQNLYYHAALHGMSRSQAGPRITEELGRIKLLDRKSDRVRALSGGQKRRVELARALIHHPSLLLLDEPTVGLDMESRHFLLQHVKHLCRTTHLGVLWATHLIDEADDNSKIIVLHHGKILANGQNITQPDETLKHAFDRLTQKKAA
jgi:ABC-2 type transport system ATP-binding protein